jgi:polar amino acid transport system substrate-binding protein
MRRERWRDGVTAALAAVAFAALSGCQIPQDPDGTLDIVRDGTLRVGVTESAPWVDLADPENPEGVEPELVRRFASRLNAEIDWIDGSEEELMGGLKEGQLDLVVGGLTRKSPWKKEASLTWPYLETRLVVGAPPGASLPDDLDGVPVAFERGGEAGGLLERKTGASAIAVDKLDDARGAVAADEWVLNDLGLRRTGVELAKHQHVMATPLGENAWLVELERFLLKRKGEIRALLQREGKP